MIHADTYTHIILQNVLQDKDAVTGIIGTVLANFVGNCQYRDNYG